MGIENLIAADAARVDLPPDAELHRIATLASEQVALEHDIERTEEELSKMKARLDELRDKTLSDLLIAHGLTEIRLADGRKVAVDRLVFASIAEKNKPAALAWLEAGGFGALIKAELRVNAGKGNGAALEPLKKLADEAGIEYKETSTVHPQTLKAFVSEQLGKGVDVPADLFGVYVVNRTKIK